MPKKAGKDGAEARKRRSSSKDVRTSTNTMMEEGLLPPTPSASHLFASNPFDDPPPPNSLTNINSAYQGPSRMLMHGPLRTPGLTSNYLSKGPALTQSPWKPVLTSPLQGPHGHFDSPMVGPVWRPGAGDIRIRHQSRPITYQMDTRLTSHPDFNRPAVSGQTLCKHSAYAPVLNGSRDEQTYAHTKVDAQSHFLQNPHYPHKSNGRKSDKEIKSDQATWQPKPRRRPRPSSDVPTKSGTLKVEEKDWECELANTDNNSYSSPPVPSAPLPPHSALPALPQTCLQCANEIKHPEDCICCLASCSAWYHRACTGLTEAAHICLKGEELALWACDNCLHMKEIDSIRTRNSVDTHAFNPKRSVTPAKA